MSTLINSIYSIPLTWQSVTSNTTISASNGYFSTIPGGLTFTLPAVLNVGDTFSVQSVETGGFVIKVDNGGQGLAYNGYSGGTLTTLIAFAGATLVACTTSLVVVNSTTGATFTMS